MLELVAKAELKFPELINISEETKVLIQKLLIKDQEKKLGTEGGFEAIKKHSFFKGFDFKELEEKKIEAPFQLSSINGIMEWKIDI